MWPHFRDDGSLEMATIDLLTQYDSKLSTTELSRTWSLSSISLFQAYNASKALCWGWGPLLAHLMASDRDSNGIGGMSLALAVNQFWSSLLPDKGTPHFYTRVQRTSGFKGLSLVTESVYNQLFGPVCVV